MNTHITEIIPKDMPEWAEDCFLGGTFFRCAIEKVEELEKQLVDKELLLQVQKQQLATYNYYYDY